MEVVATKYKLKIIPILIGICLFTQSYTLSSQSLGEELLNVFNDFQVMGMSVWVNVQGVEEEFNYGYRDFDRDLLVNSNTQYRIASVAKSFTALGLLKLYDQGLFDLDDSISEYLPYDIVNPNHPDQDLTFRMVLSHRTGLQDGDGYSSFINATFGGGDIPNISELIIEDGSYYTPNMWRTETSGSFFAYSNMNFVLAGTLIESISNERFDLFMKEQILNPLGISGSYNVLDLEDINDVSVLYRYQNGSWQPQWDNYQGTYPQAPNLENYVPGTNGLYFGPQGSLRISAADTGKFLQFISSGGASGELELSSETLDLMTAIAWDYDGSNGDNYFGLFNRWGLGLHHANIISGDEICNLGSYGSFLGHPGEAYGLVSDAYFAESQEVAFTVVINGVQNGYQSGNTSAYYTVEEAIFEKLCNYFEQTLVTENFSNNEIFISPNPSSDFLKIDGLTSEKTIYKLYSLSGKLLKKEVLEISKATLDIRYLPKGIYLLVIENSDNKQIQKIIKS